MIEFQFTLIVPAGELSHDEILDATDALGGAGCLDASIRGHNEGLELVFHRQSESLESAIASAVGDVEGAGFAVSRIEMERETITS